VTFVGASATKGVHLTWTRTPIANRRLFLSPLRSLLHLSALHPTACAVGCILSLLRSLGLFRDRMLVYVHSRPDSQFGLLPLAVVTSITALHSFHHENRSGFAPLRPGSAMPARSADTVVGPNAVADTNAAAKRRKNAAHGASRGSVTRITCSPGGAKENVAYVWKYPVALHLLDRWATSINQARVSR